MNGRRVLNGIFWVLRSGALWRDLLDSFGAYTTWLQLNASVTKRSRHYAANFRFTRDSRD